MNKKKLLLFSKTISCLLIVMAICTFTACSSSDNDDDKVVVNETKLSVYSDDLESSLGFSSNTSWTATVTPVSGTRSSSVSWIELDKYEGEAGSQTLTMTIELNETGETRSANIVIANLSGSPVTVTITQKAIKREDDEDADATTAFFISYKVDGIEYLIKTNDIEGNDLSVSSNFKELELSGYTWIFNKDRGTALGLIYSQGDPGVGLSYSITSAGNFTQNGNGFDIASRFTSYGFFENYGLTSVCGQSALNEDGSAAYYTVGEYAGQARTDQATFNIIDMDNNLQMVQRTYSTYNMTGNGQIGTLSGVCDLGNGEYLSGVVMSEPRASGSSGGSSSGIINYPDSVWVASFSLDANLNPVLNYLVKDDRISYASGRYRSQYYSSISMADDDYIYVFSPSYVEGDLAGEIAPTLPCGALRIKKGSREFDSSYYFNIEDANGGYHFKKVWFITGTYFLLELYNEKEPGRTLPSTRYGVVNMASKTFTWLDGVPDVDSISSTGLPTVYQGKIYLPITVTGDPSPAIYAINPTDGVTTKCLTLNGATSINAVGYLKYKE